MLKEVRRWESSPSENTAKQELALLKAESRFALALKKLNEKLKTTPYNKKLLDEQIELYEKLGWSEWADRVKLAMKLREQKTPVHY